MERSNRKTYRGTVVSDKMDKTITVIIETKKTVSNLYVFFKRSTPSK